MPRSGDFVVGKGEGRGAIKLQDDLDQLIISIPVKPHRLQRERDVDFRRGEFCRGFHDDLDEVELVELTLG